MTKAKAISLQVRPLQSADLCYPISGIIEYQPDYLLGTSVRAFDLIGWRKTLEPEVKIPSGYGVSQIVPLVGHGPISPHGVAASLHPDEPSCDGPADIEDDLLRAALCRLRAPDIATQLTEMIAWYGLKYSADQSDEAIAKRIQLLGKNTADPNSVLKLLDQLSARFKASHDKIAAHYQNNGVLDNNSSETTGTTDTTGGQQFTTTSSTTTTYHSREWEDPSGSNHTRWLRAEASLRQERLAAYRLVKLNSHENVVREKTLTAAEIRKVQLAYVDTFLVAPFDGVITAIFRNVGDYVAAGQPVMRLENDSTIYLVGTIKCRDLIRIGYTVTVTTTLFGEPGASPVEISGVVCAIRGHEPADEQWIIIVRCNNDGPTGRILPLNYNFEFEGTDIDITAA